jgi:hypothetical protein
MLRIAAFLILIGGTVAAGPAAAQFGNFGDSPPRPPADVPNAFPPQPPPPDQRQPFPPAPAARAPSGIQTQPLPPPPGAAAPQQGGLAPSQRARVIPPSVNPAPQQPTNPPPPQPADTAPQSDDTVVTETPTEKIPNNRAVFSGLDKITGRIISFDAGIGETVQFGALQVTARACYTRPPTEATNTDAFVEVEEVTLQGEVKRIFTGWMFASSPGLHAVEHPIYDVWLTDCSSPVQAQIAQPAAAAAAAAPAPAPVRPRKPPPPSSQPQQRRQPPPPVAPTFPNPPR